MLFHVEEFEGTPLGRGDKCQHTVSSLGIVKGPKLPSLPQLPQDPQQSL